MCKAAFLEYVDKVETAVAEEKLEVLVMIPMQQRILFDTDVSDIDEHASPIFTSVVKRLGFLSSSKVHVTGHADKPGTPEYNQTLSEKRATTVTAGLIKAGVPAGLIVSDAFGSTDPIGSNPYDALNRRVDIVIEPLKANDEAIKQAVQQMKK